MESRKDVLISDFAKKARYHRKEARLLKRYLPSVSRGHHLGQSEAFMRCARLTQIFG